MKVTPSSFEHIPSREADIDNYDVSSAGDQPPLVAIGGLLTVKQVADWYRPLLASDTSTDLPPSERFIAPHNRGLGPIENIREDLNTQLEKLFQRLGSRMFIVGHSLGALMATMAATERPDMVDGVVCLGGVHTGYKKDTLITLALRYGLGNPEEAKHLRYDSDFMEEHQENMSTIWPEGRPLHIISTPFDSLVVPPQGFDVELPANEKLEKQLIIPHGIGVERIIRSAWGIPEDVDMIRSWYPTEHLNIPRNPQVIEYIDAARRNAPGFDTHFTRETYGSELTSTYAAAA